MSRIESNMNYLKALIAFQKIISNLEESGGHVWSQDTIEDVHDGEISTRTVKVTLGNESIDDLIRTDGSDDTVSVTLTFRTSSHPDGNAAFLEIKGKHQIRLSPQS